MPEKHLPTAALRTGWTTGSCAAGAAYAAVLFLCIGRAPDTVRLQTPKGIELDLPVEAISRTNKSAVCGVRKDAGDDPDVTNGILIIVAVEKSNQNDIEIIGGEGIGRVTKPGLSCPVGAAAITPAPRAQIIAAVQSAARQVKYSGGFRVTISAENGETIAKQTYNGQLGIVGGISILGTTGIVEPMSERALMDTIHLELDSISAQGQKIALLCPGNYGEQFITKNLNIPIEYSVKCSNFIGDALDWAVYRGFSGVLLVGHAGKLVKLAAGIMNTHSKTADGRREIFTAHTALCGASSETLNALMSAVSVDACIDILDQANLREPVLHRIATAIQERLTSRVRGEIPVAFVMFTQKFGVLAQSSNVPDMRRLLLRER